MPAWLIFGLMSLRGLSTQGEVILSAAVADTHEQHQLTAAIAATKATAMIASSLMWLVGPLLSLGAKSTLVTGLACMAIASLTTVHRRRKRGS
eukprot:COSAG04_NODE_2467_length_4076_cov_2.470958_4_plen_93_part_00